MRFRAIIAAESPTLAPSYDACAVSLVLEPRAPEQATVTAMITDPAMLNAVFVIWLFMATP